MRANRVNVVVPQHDSRMPLCALMIDPNKAQKNGVRMVCAGTDSAMRKPLSPNNFHVCTLQCACAATGLKQWLCTCTEYQCDAIVWPSVESWCSAMELPSVPSRITIVASLDGQKRMAAQPPINSLNGQVSKGGLGHIYRSVANPKNALTRGDASPSNQNRDADRKSVV